MIFPEHRVAEVCRLGPFEALQLLERARAGDRESLVAWTVRAAYRKMLAKGVPAIKAMHDARQIVNVVDFKPSIVE